MTPGTRVKILKVGGDTLFGDRIGTVIYMPSTAWDVWVRLDSPLMGSYAYGFNENELEVLSDA